MPHQSPDQVVDQFIGSVTTLVAAHAPHLAADIHTHPASWQHPATLMPYDAAMSLFYTLRQGAHPVIEAAEEFPTASRAYAAIEQATRTALASTFFSVALRLTDATTVDEVHHIINRVWANSGAPRLRSALVDVVSACDTNA